MYVLNRENVYDLPYNDPSAALPVTYGDVFLEDEREFSAFNFVAADTGRLAAHFESAEQECRALVAENLPLPAYDQCIKASHLFNLLDSRGVISVVERQAYIGRVRALARACCEAYVARCGATASDAR
jgi:glycyl-tRNA synthetase alpha chain